MTEGTDVPHGSGMGSSVGDESGGIKVPPCSEVTTEELCEELKRWGTEVSEWLDEFWRDQGGNPGTDTPPPKPPFQG